MEEEHGIGVTWIPILQIAVLSLGTLASFITAYLRRDVTVYLPYISETGAWPPESGIFTLTVICGSFLGILVVIVRYLIVADSSQEHIVMMLNRKALYFGLISWFGVCVVAAFPMYTVLPVHLVGAGTHFVLGLVYVLLQTVISHKMVPVEDKLRIVVKIRFGLCGFLLVFLVFLLIMFPISYFNWKKKHGSMSPARKTPDDSGFGLVTASSFFEWSMYVVFLSYFATFLAEFRNYRFVTSVHETEIAKMGNESIATHNRTNYVT